MDDQRLWFESYLVQPVDDSRRFYLPPLGSTTRPSGEWKPAAWSRTREERRREELARGSEEPRRGPRWALVRRRAPCPRRGHPAGDARSI